MLRENENGESGLESSSSRDHGSRSNRRYGTAAGTAAVERGDHAFVPRVLASTPLFHTLRPTFCSANRSCSLSPCSLVSLASWLAREARGHEGRLWREHSRIVGRGMGYGTRSEGDDRRNRRRVGDDVDCGKVLVGCERCGAG